MQPFLDVGRIQHNADAVSHSDSREIGCELGSDSSRTSMRAGDLTPDGTDLGFLGLVSSRCLVAFALVDESALLSNVEPRVLFGGATFNLEERGIFVLVAETTLITGENGLGVQPATVTLN